MSTFYVNEQEYADPLVLEDTDEEEYEYEEDDEYDEEDEEYVDLEEDEEAETRETKLDDVPSRQIVKPDLTTFWIIMLTTFIFFMLMSISTAYLSGNSWVVNNNVEDQIKGMKNNIARLTDQSTSSDCLTCISNGDETFTTLIRGIMDISALSTYDSQFQTGLALDNTFFDVDNVNSNNAQTLFLFDNNFGASSGFYSNSPGLISLPISNNILPTQCSTSNVFESSIYANIDISNNLQMCICDTTDNYCFQLS